MKTTLASLTIALSVLIVSSCTKVQLDQSQDESKSKAPSKTSPSACKPTSFVASSILDPGYTNRNFEKTIDPTTGRVSSIKVGIYSGGSISDEVSFDLVYKNKNIFVLKSGSTSDTAMTIKLNNEGFADFTVDGNSPDGNFAPTRFKYRNGLVATRSISLFGSQLTANFSYDRNNNLVLIQEVSLNGEEPGRSEYEYDLSRTASGQAYYDEPRGYSENTYMLLQYLGLLPLQPKNVRTATRVYWEKAYQVYDAKLLNHVIDASGNLVSYESAISAESSPSTHYTITWNCGTGTPTGDVQ